MTFLAADGVDAVERGPRLRDAADHPARRAAGRADRARAAVPRRPRRRRDRADGRRLPELARAPREDPSACSRAEEERFARDARARAEAVRGGRGASGEISGDDAFRLHDTYGFPLELTQELARERGLAGRRRRVQRALMERAARALAQDGADGRRASSSDDARSEFVGYEKTESLTAILAYEDLGDGRFQAKLEASPFYPEGGGQVTDAGYIEDEETGARAELVAATRLPGDDQVLTFEGEGFREGMRVRAVVPWAVRFPTMANHTATHLLHKALQEVLGEHAKQAGSAVRPDKLRFDFTHPQALRRRRARGDRAAGERAVFENLPVRAFVVPIDEARQARRDDALRREVRRRGARRRDRRLLARALRRHARARDRGDRAVRDPLRELGRLRRRGGSRPSPSGEAYALLHGRAREVDELRAELERVGARRPTPRGEGRGAVEPRSEEAIGGVNVFVGRVARGRRRTRCSSESDRIKQERAPAAVVLGATEDGRVHLVANFDRSLEGRLDAVAVIKEAAAEVGGGGGGRPTMARAGGSEPVEARRGPREGGGGAAQGPRVKVLALDYGSARTGVAVSDPTGTIARPLGVVERAASEAWPARARRARPRRGRRACRRRPAADAARRARRRRPARPTRSSTRCARSVDVPVESYDERFTTGLAAARAPGGARGRARRGPPAVELPRVGERRDGVMPPRPRPQRRTPRSVVYRRRRDRARGARRRARRRLVRRRERRGLRQGEAAHDDGRDRAPEAVPGRLPRGLHAAQMAQRVSAVADIAPP